MANRAKKISSKTACKIRELRIQAGLTQKELAQKLYKSESAVRMWELGKSEPDLLSVNALAEIFGVSADTILGTDTSPALSDPTISENKRKLIEWAQTVPEDKVEPILQALQSILAALQ